MRLYLLEDREEFYGGYDCCSAIVVRAEGRREARIEASKVAMDEGVNMWLNPKKSTCILLQHDGSTEVIIRHIYYG